MQERVLVTGALGQLGQELSEALAKKYGSENVWLSDIREEADVKNSQYVCLNVMDQERICDILRDKKITVVYHLAALLSANAEKDPLHSWELNMKGLLNLLEAMRLESVKKMFWPSSIAVFGPQSPKDDSPQNSFMDPTTVYGISKLAGEHWKAYYQTRYGLDIRSVRYPGLISWSAKPGGGTTDYAVDVFHKAVQGQAYDCYLEKDAALPMMYMSDAVTAAIQLMEAPKDRLSVRMAYNLAAWSFTPGELAERIRRHYPDFEINYKPDFRQVIADSWPDTIDDAAARADWGWHEQYSISEMTDDMIQNLSQLYKREVKF